jgi:hypothetical protein
MTSCWCNLPVPFSHSILYFVWSHFCQSCGACFSKERVLQDLLRLFQEVKKFLWILIGLNFLTAVIQLGLSGKWPDDLCAVRRIKAAFYIKIAESLSKQFHLTVQPFPDFVHVLKVRLYQKSRGVTTETVPLLIRATLFGWRKYVCSGTYIIHSWKVWRGKFACWWHVCEMINGPIHVWCNNLSPFSCLTERFVFPFVIIKQTIKTLCFCLHSLLYLFLHWYYWH